MSRDSLHSSHARQPSARAAVCTDCARHRVCARAAWDGATPPTAASARQGTPATTASSVCDAGCCTLADRRCSLVRQRMRQWLLLRTQYLHVRSDVGAVVAVTAMQHSHLPVPFVPAIIALHCNLFHRMIACCRTQLIDSCCSACQNGGTCTSYGLGLNECLCTSQWTGPACNIPACRANCYIHGSCVNGQCVCNPGWSGTNCDTRLARVCACISHVQCSGLSWRVQRTWAMCGAEPVRLLFVAVLQRQHVQFGRFGIIISVPRRIT